jgi:PEGA domain-containing protein
MSRQFVLSAFVCFYCWTLAGGQGPTEKFVADPELELTIAEGLREKGRSQGLELVDVGQQLSAAFATVTSPSATGYRVVLYTPLAWIKQQASNAAKEYRPFTLADITPDMRQDVLRVVVYPSMPTHVIARGSYLAHSVQHVVIRDADRNRVVQPIRKDMFTEEAQNALGAKLEYKGVSALFPLSEVEKLRDENEEFFVTVIGQKGERDFKVKRKHLGRLPFGHIMATSAEPGPSGPPDVPPASSNANSTPGIPKVTDKPDSVSTGEGPSHQTPQQLARSSKQALAFVTINSFPDAADITIDGKNVGKTPFSIRLSPGEHTVSVGKSGFMTWQWTTTVDPDDLIRINQTLEPSRN